MTAKRIAWVLISVGVALHVYIDVFLSDRPASEFGVIGVILWPSLRMFCAPSRCGFGDLVRRSEGVRSRSDSMR